jgi:predicted phage-related endonuclease
MIAEGTAEWVKARIGMLTGSRMADAMDYRKDKQPGARRVKLLKDLLAERLTGYAVDHYVSPAMQWGLDHEDEGKAAFEAATGEIIVPAGFSHHPHIDFFGATPDGLLDEGGIFELKCPTTATHIDYLLGQVVPEEYRPQMIAGMLCTGRQWGMFASFDPRMPPKQRLFVRRFDPTPEQFSAVESAAVSFLRDLDALFDAIHKEADARLDTRE